MYKALVVAAILSVACSGVEAASNVNRVRVYTPEDAAWYTGCFPPMDSGSEYDFTCRDEVLPHDLPASTLTTQYVTGDAFHNLYISQFATSIVLYENLDDTCIFLGSYPTPSAKVGNDYFFACGFVQQAIKVVDKTR